MARAGKAFARRHGGGGLGPRLIALLLVAGVVPMAVLGAVAYVKASSALRSDADARVREIAFNAVETLDRNLFERYGDVQAFAKSAPARAMDPAALTDWMDTMMGTYAPIYDLMVVADASGRIVAANTVDGAGEPVDTSALLGRDVTGDEWFRTATDGSLAEGATAVGDLHEDELAAAVYGGGAPQARAMSFTFPIRDETGEIVGVWSNRFHWGVASDVLASVVDRARAGGADSTSVYLLDRSGRLLASPSGDGVLEQLARDVPGADAAGQPGAGGSGEGDDLDGSGEQVLVGLYRSDGYESYPGLGWTAIATQRRGEALAASSGLLVITLAILGGCALALVLVAIRVKRRALRVARRLSDATARAAGGDLTARWEACGIDEIDAVGGSFDGMVESLAGLVRRIGDVSTDLHASSGALAESSEQTGRAVEEIAAAIMDVAQGAESQLRLAESARQSVDGMTRAVDASAQSAEETLAAAEEARRLAEEGVTAASRASAAMDELRGSTQEIDEAIRELGERSRRIGGIVDTIEEIAGQTNLLALNAAIEAARAGEQGRGFAVVAEQVRVLAEQSQAAARSIGSLVSEIQSEMQRVERTADEGGRRTEEGAAVVEQARTSFLAIGAAVEDMTARIAAVAVAASEVRDGATHARGEIEEVAGVAESSSATSEQVSASAQETTASSEEIAAAAQELARTAQELTGVVGSFRL